MSCSLPPLGTRWAPDPDVRGTTNIITASLSVILLSTWSVLHLNVPVQSTHRNKYQNLGQWAARAAAKVLWMFMTVPAPDYLVARSLVQLMRAHRFTKLLERYAEIDDVDWTLAHSFFADMKGFEIVFADAITEPDRHLGSRAGYNLRRDGTAKKLASIGACIAKATLEWRPGCPQKDSIYLQPKFSVAPTENNFEKDSLASCLTKSDSFESFESLDEVEKDTRSQCHTAESLPINPHYPFTMPLGRPRHWYHALERSNVTKLATIIYNYKSHASHIGAIAWSIDRTNFELVSLSRPILASQNPSMNNASLAAVNDNLDSFTGNSWRLNILQLYEARKLNIIPHLPRITKSELLDRSSSDALLRLITLAQILWQLSSVSSRLQSHLPTAPLEILTLALASCAFLTNLFFWHKPKDVQTTTRVRPARRATPSEILRLAALGDVPGDNPYAYGPLVSLLHEGAVQPHAPHDRHAFTLGLLLGGTIFGSLHFASWQHAFPTSLELQLWRIAAIASLTSPFLVALGYQLLYGPVGDRLRRTPEGSKRRNLVTHGYNCIVAPVRVFYVCVRVFVVVECARTLFYLEPETFRASSGWVGWLPHVQ